MFRWLQLSGRVDGFMYVLAFIARPVLYSQCRCIFCPVITGILLFYSYPYSYQQQPHTHNTTDNMNKNEITMKLVLKLEIYLNVEL